ncbi:hypothetical protein X777_14409, partial [Ooceraea biroi]
QFDCLLGLIGPYITKQETILRTPIPAITRLAVTLRYLACGDRMVSLSYQFRIGQSTRLLQQFGIFYNQLSLNNQEKMTGRE